MNLEDGDVVLIRKDDQSRLIISKTAARAKKDEFNRKRGLARLEKRIKSGKLTKSSINNKGFNKYLKMEGEMLISINMDKFHEDAAWDGIKGYLTNTSLSKKKVIENYQNLFLIERAFRMNKTDLEMRPIYHRLRNRIEGHICICFTAYTIMLELERLLKKNKSTQVTSGGVLYIRAIQGSRTSSAALVYDPEATSKADLPVLVYNEIPLTLYAFSPGREALSIRTSNDFQSRATDLGLRVMNAGEMKLEFSGLSTFGHDVYLQDKQLGKTIDLQNNPVYTFTVAAIELNDRFSLGMTYTGKGIVTGSESAPAPAALQVSSKDGYLDVQSQGGKIDRLQVYSLMGSLIYSSNSSSGRFNIPLSGGVYIVKGQIGATYYTEKAVVR
ncbi:hypothetical protein AGMMS49574_22580 [Bacteroidia bacterium]|nr:hypothetical protein AGMMS49574_22580 [Bacteroidia bacterium]